MTEEMVIADHPAPGIHCDFCTSTAIVARYLCKTFRVRVATDKGPMDYTSRADWAVCGPCHELIKAEEWHELLTRSLASNMINPDGSVSEVGELDPVGVTAMHVFLKALHDGFRHHRVIGNRSVPSHSMLVCGGGWTRPGH